ncbi:3'-5' exonuclease [Aspergillus clavatus NRRL 1]|uniref:3'-5' exonuclease/helicase (Wrn), putative n=1 Tax=Aspergillus clavatus (strain ATCC 1007 / CBS 513.65 / DSM 816 / NCTC 3887 / NRRL 1 / QM 1276 / 107) TaxID=344612 RepID=A1CDB4_ASPCL|nr:3'-5' exonuclease/helicase (Wrn), putative [Aspergillus clavatus NRRL 1]EAW11841.1 3'-5' exonuclease/helicase (Wrn), putative [Aspergillus clavatus NRRL 1]
MSKAAASDQYRKTFRPLSGDMQGPAMSFNFKRVRRCYSSLPAAVRASDDGDGLDLATQNQSCTKGKEISQSTKPEDQIDIRLPSDEKDLVAQQAQAKPDSATVPAVLKYWSHRLHKTPSGKDIIVHYCKSLEKSEEVAKYFLNDKVIGFDMEWKPQATKSAGIRSNVSLIQIANSERIALFQIALFKPAKKAEDFVAASLRKILESPEIMKVGVTIKADCTRLRKYLGIDTRGTLELSHLYKLVKYSESNPKLINKRPVSLSDQVEEHFGMPLEKDGNVRCSNWATALNYRQVQYAATDPYACFRLFDTMNTKRKALDPMPPLPEYAELDLPIRLAEAVLVENEIEAENDAKVGADKEVKSGADDAQDVDTAIGLGAVVIKSELVSVTCTA